MSEEVEICFVWDGRWICSWCDWVGVGASAGEALGRMLDMMAGQR